MTRRLLTATIRARGGKVRASGNGFACYTIPMTEEKFIKFRKTIPWVTVWQTGTMRMQYFTVHFGQLKGD